MTNDVFVRSSGRGDAVKRKKSRDGTRNVTKIQGTVTCGDRYARIQLRIVENSRTTSRRFGEKWPGAVLDFRVFLFEQKSINSQNTEYSREHIVVSGLYVWLIPKLDVSHVSRALSRAEDDPFCDYNRRGYRMEWTIFRWPVYKRRPNAVTEKKNLIDWNWIRDLAHQTIRSGHTTSTFVQIIKTYTSEK